MVALLGTGAAESGPVVPSIALDALLAQRDAAVEQLRAIAGAVGRYREVGTAIWGSEEDAPMGRSMAAPYKFREPVEQRPSGAGCYLTDERWLEESIASVDAALWDHLLDKSGLRTFMDHKAREEWAEQIEKGETPPLTQENVIATFRSLHAQRGEFFERGVIGVFRSLSWDYATNRPHRFGKRLILRGVYGFHGLANSERCDLLDDLERVMHVLDGKPEPDHREGVYRRLSRRTDKAAPVADAYLTIKVFKNGNAHVAMLRSDLVDEFNRILARHYPDALPPCMEAA